MNRGIRVLQTRALPLGYGAIYAQHIFTICPSTHFYPPGCLTARGDFGAEDGIRTRDFDLGKVALYH